MSLCCALQYQAPRLILDVHDVLGPSLKSSTMGTLSVLSTTTEPWWSTDSDTKAGKKEGQEKEQDFMDMGPSVTAKNT